MLKRLCEDTIHVMSIFMYVNPLPSPPPPLLSLGIV